MNLLQFFVYSFSVTIGCIIVFAIVYIIFMHIGDEIRLWPRRKKGK